MLATVSKWPQGNHSDYDHSHRRGRTDHCGRSSYHHNRCPCPERCRDPTFLQTCTERLNGRIGLFTTTISDLIIITYPLTAMVAVVPKMIWQPVSSIFPCSPLPSGTCRTPGLSIPWCCLLTSSFVRLVFFPLSLCLVRWFWPDLMNGRHVHTTAVCISLRWSGSLRVVRLPAGSW